MVAGAEGGMILTADTAVRDEARIYRDQGKASFLGGGHVRLGVRVAAERGAGRRRLVHLQRLDEFIGGPPVRGRPLRRRPRRLARAVADRRTARKRQQLLQVRGAARSRHGPVGG